MKKIIIVFIALCIISCNSNYNQKKPKKEKKSTSYIDDILCKDFNQIIYIISVKNQIDTLLSKQLIAEYLMKQDSYKYMELVIYGCIPGDTTSINKSFGSSEKIGITINTLSKKYSIDKSKLSNFIFDFKIYDKAGCTKEN